MVIRIGVVGVGAMGEKHTQNYSTHKEADLAGVCDIKEERAREVASRFNTTFCTDYRQLLNKVEGVTIATPTDSHYSIAKYFLENGVNVLVEKPITLKEKQAGDLIKESRNKNLIFQVGHIERYNPAIIKLRELVNKPLFIECHRLSPYPGRGTEVGVVLDLMIHDLDVILSLVSSPIKSVEAFGAKVLSADEDIANARIYFQSGCVANITASRLSEKVVRKIRIFQPSSYLSVDYLHRHISMVEKQGKSKILKKDFPLKESNPLKEELQDFITSIKHQKSPLVDGEAGLKSLELASLIVRNMKCAE